MDFITFVGFISAILGIISFIFLDGDKKLKSFIFFLLLAISFFAGGYFLNSTENQNDSINELVYRRLNEIKEFSDYKDLGGMLVGEFQNDDYAIGFYKKNGHDFLTLEKVIRIPDEQYVKYLLIDTITIPRLKDNEVLAFGCQRKNKTPTFAISEYKDAEYFTEIKKAWKVNFKTKKIEEIYMYNFTCPNESYGI